jgi:hypothetical protein
MTLLVKASSNLTDRLISFCELHVAFQVHNKIVKATSRGRSKS